MRWGFVSAPICTMKNTLGLLSFPACSDSATLFLSLVAPPPKESREKMKSEAATAWKCAKSSTKGGRRGALEDVDVSMKSRYGVVASIYIQMINTTINID